MEAGRNLSPRLVLPSSPPLPPPARKHAPSSSVEYSPPHRPALSSKPPQVPSKSPPAEAAPPLFPTNEIASLPLAPLPHHLAPFLLPDCLLTREEKHELFTRVFLKSASSGNSDTLEWLLSIPTTPSASASTTNHRFSAAFGIAGQILHGRDLEDGIPRKWVDLDARDEEGNSALGLAVALGHAEVVRVLVEGGIDINGGDKAGWTALHWAAQNNDIPIASYLLNHRATVSLLSHKGLRPRDLIKRGKEGAAMREVLNSAEEAAAERDMLFAAAEEVELLDDYPHSPNGKGKEREFSRSESRASIADSIASSSRSRAQVWDEEKVEEERRELEMQKRMELAMESALNLEVDVHVLGLEGKDTSITAPQDDDEDGLQNPFIWERCLPDQMIVFSLDDLSIIFDVVITNMKPVRARLYRVIPANVVFLCARFAHYFGGRELLDELFLGAIERIEAAVHHRPDDMANCAFWLSNSLLLLYYLRKEPNLYRSTDEFQTHLSDLVNEIFVFIIRDAERRIDRILESAMLDYEGLPGFEDVRFEGDWSSNRFVQKLTGRGKKIPAKPPSAMSIFSTTEPATSGTSNGSPGHSRQSSQPKVLSAISPRKITSLLSSTLFILQIYEIPPSIVVQAFSQLYYWVSCEVFNRLLTQKKLLCRSKAMQIRLNVTVLEDWARLNRLPAKMVSVHFAPLSQILQWLQCLSSESSIDGLIGTIQSLRSLNPLQLRRAVREYRYEVDEPRISEDCTQYLSQIEKQWERVRVQKTAQELETKTPKLGDGEHLRSHSPTESMLSVQSDASKMIDEVFSDPSSFGHYAPPGGQEALGELLNSRYMLPFAVPSSAEMLVNFRTKDAFGPFASQVSPASTFISTFSENQSVRQMSSRGSMQSYTSIVDHLGNSPPLGGALAIADDTRFVPVLPDDFFSVIDAAKSHAYGRPVPKAAETYGWKGSEEESEEEEDEGDTSGDYTGGEAQAEGGWFDWREGIRRSGDDDEDDEEYERRFGAVLDTPRPSIGFAPRVSM